jgi:hypothetical protein
MLQSNTRKWGIGIYCLLLLLVIADRWLLLHNFTFVFVDDDQSIMWYAAKEFAAGHFHEPCFYGQAYNTQFESLIAVPLLWCGVSYPVALTVMMSVLTLFPFVLFSYLLLRKQQLIQALLLLSIPLLLPVEYGMITAISRGVITGTFFAALAITPFFTRYKGDFFVFGFLGMLALFANPSTVLLLFPAGVWLFAENFRNRKFYVQALAGAVPGTLVWMWVLHFYSVHPDYIAHGTLHANLEMSLRILKPYEWNKFFNYVMPLFWNFGILIFPVLLLMAIVLIKQREQKTGYSLLAGIVLLFFSLTIFRVHYGFPTVFLSWARMYTAIPVLIALYVSRIHYRFSVGKSTVVLALVSISFFFVKCCTVGEVVQRETDNQKDHAMNVSRIVDLQIICDTIQRCAKQYDVELIVVGNAPEKHLITYGCPCMNNALPLVLEPALDRRRWLLDTEENAVRKNILFVAQLSDMVPEQLLNYPGVEKVSEDPLMFVLSNNALPTREMLSATGFPMR